MHACISNICQKLGQSFGGFEMSCDWVTFKVCNQISLSLNNNTVCISENLLEELPYTWGKCWIVNNCMKTHHDESQWDWCGGKLHHLKRQGHGFCYQEIYTNVHNHSWVLKLSLLCLMICASKMQICLTKVYCQRFIYPICRKIVIVIANRENRSRDFVHRPPNPISAMYY